MQKAQPLVSDAMVPLYQQLHETILKKVESGEYGPGDRIPSEQQLSEMYGVSRITVRNALKRLVDEDILVKKHGKGTFVTMPEYVESLFAGGSFTESCLQISAVPGTHIIASEKITADAELASHLEMTEGSQAICLTRLRIVDGLPAIFEKDYFQPRFDFLMQIDLQDKSILDVIRKYTGMQLKEFADVFDVCNATDFQAHQLDCAPGTPLLYIKQTVYAEKRRLMYFNKQYIRTDRYKYAVRSY